MPFKLSVYSIAVIVGLAWGILLVVNGFLVPSLFWLRSLSFVTGTAIFSLILFDVWFWRLSFLRGWLIKRPFIGGTWKTSIYSHWPDSLEGNTIKSIEGFMSVHQTFYSLSMRLMTSESTSELFGSEVKYAEDGVIKVVALYRNEPKISVRDQSAIHNGAFILTVIGDPPTSINGHYWTDRNTRGELKLEGKIGKKFADYDEAREYFSHK